MSIVFSPMKLGHVQIKNRFIHSACEDNMSTATGVVTDNIIRKLTQLAQGEVGLIIWSHICVHPTGRNKKFQGAIYDDGMIPGLKQAVQAVHDHGGKIGFQLGHGGIQAEAKVTGQELWGPASMTETQIAEMIRAFKEATRRAVASGVDAVQLHAAHGYLINEFLSPFFNRREDEWGGSEENRFRFLKEIVLAVKSVLPREVALLVKLNSHDHTKTPGIVPELAATYAQWLNGLGIDGLEISCGTSLGSSFAMCRGDVPVEEMLMCFPASARDRMRAYLESQAGLFDLTGPYNVDAARIIRPVFGDTPLFAVGGWRTLEQMERAVTEKQTDFISMCRPFIREPNLVKRLKEGKTTQASCKSCNKCLAAIPNNLPVRCYYAGFPKQETV